MTASDSASDRASFFASAAETTSLLGVETAWGTFVVRTDDSNVGRQLFVDRTRGEIQVLQRAIKALARLGAGVEPQRTTFLDVGANIGTTTIPALGAVGFRDAIACEPDPTNVAILRANLALNGLAERAQVHAAAVSDGAGTGRLARHRSNRGAHVLTTGTEATDVPAELYGESIEVPTLTLDDVDGERVGLVWLDVQGHEAHALAGAGDLTRRGVPVVLELAPALLERAGALSRLLAIAEEHYTHFLDLRRWRLRDPVEAACGAAADLGRLTELGESHTDVLLVRLARTRRPRWYQRRTKTP